ncbi:MAG: response regulator [Desulfobacterales bacterium]|nr:response regulator [Desulfobacterales bacterium]
MPTYKQKILIVDDEPANIRMLAEALKGDFKLIQARNGQKALKHAFSENKPDLILLDILMPEMDGYEVCRRLKADERTQNIPIIFITAMDEEEDEAKGFELGAADYITKPFSPFRVKTRVFTHLELKRHRNNIEGLLTERTAKLVEANEKLKKEIDERKRLEKEAELQHQNLIQADKMIALGVLVSGMAHEINNPNNFIMINTPIIKEAWENVIPILEEYYENNGDFKVAGMSYTELRENIPDLFSGIIDGSERIMNIVKNLKDYARQESSDMTQEIDVNDVIDSAIPLLSNQIKKSTNKFEKKLGKDLPLIKGNFQRIEQVLINLLQNACHAITDPDKGISIVTHYFKESGRVVIEVSDEGIGILPKNLPYILDPFFTTKRDIGGTGLGLSICAGIVEEHGGALECASETEKGTTFRVWLPVSRKLET